MVDSGGGGQVRDEVGRRGAPGRSLVRERNEVLDVGGTGAGEKVDEAQEDLSRRTGVSESSVLGNGGGTEIGGDRAQLVVAHERAGQSEPRKRQRVDDANARPRARARAGSSAQEAHVEGCVMRDEDGGILGSEA